jgi:hypothetical protein
MHPVIDAKRSDISQLCREFHVVRLEVFGSAARASDFDPASTDADFLVQFAPDAMVSLKAYFGLKNALEALLGRKVDLVEAGAVGNPYFQASINRDLEVVYAA